GQMKRYPVMTIREYISYGLRYATDLTRQFVRRSAQEIISDCMNPSLRNPLATDLTAGVFNAATQIRPCSMHVVNLGVLQVLSGSVVDMLVKAGFFGSTEPAVALHTASLRFKQYASAHRLVHSVPFLTPNMLVDASTAGSYPVLTLKAFNGRLFLGFLSACLRAAVAKGPNPDLELRLAERCTHSLLLWFQIQENAPRRFIDPATGQRLLQTGDEFLRLYHGLAQLACQRGEFRWKILPKHHDPSLQM
ncbi:unnamed protein product, partial [Symbiodinium sp. CCMP2592]